MQSRALDSTAAEAIGCVVIDHARGLHEGVADGAADEAEAALLQIFAHGVRFGRSRGDSLQAIPRIDLWLAANELPNVLIEGAELFLYSEEGFGVADRGGNFQAIADDPGVAQQRSRLARIVFCDFARVKPVERAAIIFTFIEDCFPA